MCLKLASRSTQSLFRTPMSFNQFAGIQRSTVSANEIGEPNWNPIFKFKYINFLVSLNKLKMYQIAATAAIIPAAFAINEAAIEGLENLPLIASSVGISGLMTLSLASYAIKGTIGFIYLNNRDPDLVKFSYMDFWGRRRDVEIEIVDVIPPSENPKSFFDKFYTTLRFHNGQDGSRTPNMKMFHKLGGIIDHTEFLRIFGGE